MPRRAAADFGFPNAVAKRLSPPDEVVGPEREVFLATVFANNPDHFREGELPLLCAYCDAVVRRRVASAELAAAGYIAADGKGLSPRAQLLKDSVRHLTVTARLLRLTPLSRAISPTPKPEPVSWVERQRLLRSRDASEPSAN